MPNPDGSLTPEEFKQAQQAMVKDANWAGGGYIDQGATRTNAAGEPSAPGLDIGAPSEISIEDFRRAQQVDNADVAIAQLPRNPKAGQDGVWGWVTGNSRREYDIPEFSAGLLGSAATAMAFDDGGKMGIIQKMFADDQPTFTPDKFGNMMVTFGSGSNQGKTFYINEPGFSTQDATTLGYNAALTAIPGGLAVNVARAAGARGALAVGTSAALGGMAGDATRQVAGNALGDATRQDNLIPGINLPEMVTAGAGEGTGAYAANLFPRTVPIPGAPANIVDNVREAGALSERTGIPFFRSQVEDTGAARARASNLSAYPQTSGPMRDAMEKQSAAVVDKVTEFVNASPTAQGVLAEGRVQNAAGQVIADAKEARRVISEEAYSAALDGRPPIDTTPLVSGLEKVRGGLTKNDPLRPTLDKALEDLNAEDMWQLSGRQIQDVRITVNDAYNEALRQGKNGLARKLKPVVDQIDGFLEQNAAGYKAANELYTIISKPVDRLEASAIEALANADEFTIAHLAKQLFSSDTKAATREFVKNNLNNVDPGLYGDIARAELQRRLKSMPDYGAAGGPRNVPLQLNKTLFTDEATREMWKQALPGFEQKIDDLADALDIASRSRAGQSATVEKGADAAASASSLESAKLNNETFYGNVKNLMLKTLMYPVRKVGGPITNRIRQGQLAEEIGPDFNKLADDLLEQTKGQNGKLDLAVSNFVQAAKQYVASEPDPQDKPAKPKQGVLAE